MKKFVFPLQKVSDLKDQFLTKEKDALAVLRKEEGRLLAEKDTLAAKCHHCQETLRTQTVQGTTPPVLAASRCFLDALRNSQQDLEQQLTAVRKRIDQQMALVLELKKELRSLEELKERQWQAYRKEEQKEEEQFIEEFVSTKLVMTRLEATP